MILLKFLYVLALPLLSFTNPQFATYWQLQTRTLVPLSEIPKWIDIIIVSFATMNLDSTLSFPINDIDMLNGIRIARDSNQTVLLSIGGSANCGPLGISEDQMFGMDNFDSTIWANSLVPIINNYNFSGIDIDYECRSGIIQNPINVVLALQEIKTIIPNIYISWAAFSVVSTPSSWENYKNAFINVAQYINVVFWITYNINIDPIVATNWYSAANLTDITKFGIPLNNIFYGYCQGLGCAYGIGPSNEQIVSWANNVKNYGGGGLFLWDLEGEFISLNNNITEFNTLGISKQVSNILHK